VDRAEHPIAVRMKLGAVGFDEATKRVLLNRVRRR
jgi:hypothetical protein